MADFKTRVDDLTSFGSWDDIALADWLNEGVKELINTFPPDIIELCYSKDNFTSVAAGSESKGVDSQHVGHVFVGGVRARRISPEQKYEASETGNVHEATSTDPVYYIEGSKINALPDSLSTDAYVVQYPTVAVTDTSIATFPNSAEHLVVLYASKKALQRLMTETIDSLYTIFPSLQTLPTPPVVPAVGTITVPTVPTITTITGGTIATYNPTSGAISHDDVSSDWSTDFPTYTPIVNDQTSNLSQLNTFLVTNEDPELATVQIERINAEVNKFANDIQNELNDFNDKNAKYQGKLQAKLQNAANDVQVNIQKANNDLQAEITKANNELQKSRGQIDVDIQVVMQNNTMALQKYQAETQAYSSQFQQEQIKLQKFQQELALYQADLQKVVQIYQADVQYYQANVQHLLQEKQAMYQWYQSQYQIVTRDYGEGLMVLTGRGTQPQETPSSKGGAQ